MESCYEDNYPVFYFFGIDMRLVKMQTATLSSKYQLAIPKAIRETLALEAGQKFTVIPKGRVIELVPTPSLQAMRGIITNANPKHYRDRQDRL